MGDDPRIDPPLVSDERATLLGFVRWQRDTFVMKCSGLAPEQLAERAVPPSALSLLGLVRHLADVERAWFRRRMSRLTETEVPRLFAGEEAFAGATGDAAVVEEAWSLWHAEVAFTDAFIAEAPDLDVVGVEEWRGELSLRWVLVHLIEEYARHNGHADLVRERLDGAVGQ